MKIVVLEPLGVEESQLRSMLEAAVGPENQVVCCPDRAEDVPTLIQRSQDADVVVLSNFRYGREVMSHCPNLKLVCVAFTGVDHVDLEYCKERGIAVCNCSGYATVAVAELTWGMILELCRSLRACDKAVRNGGTKAGLVGFEVAGKTLGVVGCGAIGSQVARLGQAFGCRVLAFNRSPISLPGVEQVSLEELLRQSDIVSLNVPQTPETVGLINAETLGWMKPSALLINTARGPVVDSAALAAALREGRLAGAGIDVFEMEPPVPGDHPLLDAPNLLLTPHVAFATRESMVKRADIVCDNLRSWLDGALKNRIC